MKRSAAWYRHHPRTAVAAGLAVLAVLIAVPFAVDDTRWFANIGMRGANSLSSERSADSVVGPSGVSSAVTQKTAPASGAVKGGTPIIPADRTSEFTDGGLTPYVNDPFATNSAADHQQTETHTQTASTADEQHESDDTQNEEPNELSISGWVRSTAGEGVASIEVAASLKRLLSVSQDALSPSGRTHYRVHTDATGAFAFSRVANGEYELRTAENDYYHKARMVVRAGNDSAVLVVTEKHNREFYVYGVVESVDGGALSGVRVVPTSVRTTEHTYTDAGGNYVMYLTAGHGGGNHGLRFTKEGYWEERLPVRTTDSNESAVQLNAQLRPIGDLASVQGTLTSTGGTPINGAVVQLYSAHRQRSYRTGSNFAGRFSIPEVEVEAGYRLWVHPQGRYKDHLQEGLEVPESGLNLSITLEALNNASLQGQMVDVRRKPVPGFSLWLQSQYATDPRYLLVTADQQGAFFVPELPEGGLRVTSRSAPRFTISGIELAAGRSNNVLLTLDVGSFQAFGRVVDADNDPIPGAQATLSWSHLEKGVRSQSHRQTFTDAAGEFSFAQLGPGHHTLTVQAPGYRAARVAHQVDANARMIEIKMMQAMP